MEKFNKICRYSGSYHSDSAPAPGGDSYPESPAAKPQTDYFTDVAHSTKGGDSGGAAPATVRFPAGTQLICAAGRYAMQMSGMMVDATR